MKHKFRLLISFKSGRCTDWIVIDSDAIDIKEVGREIKGDNCVIDSKGELHCFTPDQIEYFRLERV
jgi:hypothetical protein